MRDYEYQLAKLKLAEARQRIESLERLRMGLLTALVEAHDYAELYRRGMELLDEERLAARKDAKAQECNGR